MRIYRFTLPKTNNSGLTMLDGLALFRREVLNIAGGFTEQPSVKGVWRGGDGKTYFDESWVIDVALDDTAKYQAVLTALKGIWTDQLSFFVADIGEAYFIDGLAAGDPAIAA